jgi:hypothetical protein
VPPSGLLDTACARSFVFRALAFVADNSLSSHDSGRAEALTETNGRSRRALA